MTGILSLALERSRIAIRLFVERFLQQDIVYFTKHLVPLHLAVMASSTPLDPLFRGSTSKNTRGLLRVTILLTIAAAAVTARLFSVIRMFGRASWIA